MNEQYIKTFDRTKTHILLVSVTPFDIERPNSNVLANVRKQYYEKGYVPQGKVTEAWGGSTCKYLYSLSKNLPLRWRKYENSVLVESVNISSDHYFIETINSVDFFAQKKTYFSREHDWMKTEYFSWDQVGPAKTIKCHLSSNNINLLLIEKGVETILYPCLMPDSELEMKKMRDIAHVPEISAHTTDGYFYYAPYEEAINWGRTLLKLKSEFRSEPENYDENVDRENGFYVDLDAVENLSGEYKINIPMNAGELAAKFDEEYESVDIGRVKPKNYSNYETPRIVAKNRTEENTTNDVNVSNDYYSDMFNDVYDNSDEFTSDYDNYGMNYEDVPEYDNYDMNYEDVQNYDNQGMSYEDAPEYDNQGMSHEDVQEYDNQGMSYEDVQDYDNQGMNYEGVQEYDNSEQFAHDDADHLYDEQYLNSENVQMPEYGMIDTEGDYLDDLLYQEEPYNNTDMPMVSDYYDQSDADDYQIEEIPHEDLAQHSAEVDNIVDDFDLLGNRIEDNPTEYAETESNIDTQDNLFEDGVWNDNIDTNADDMFDQLMQDVGMPYDNVTDDSQQFVVPENIGETIDEASAETSQYEFTEEQSLPQQPEPELDNNTGYMVDKIISVSPSKTYYYIGDLNQGKRDGFGRTFMESGRTAYEGEYKDDKRDGFGVYYYKSGKLCHMGSWKKNKRNGFGVALNGTHDQMRIGRWENNELVGMETVFDADGNMLFAGYREDGIKNGAGLTVTSDGGFELCRYKDDVAMETSAVFDRNGKLVYNGAIKNGEKNGFGISFRDDGTIEYSGMWKNGIYHGEGRLCRENGEVIEGTFDNGKSSGFCRCISSTGEPYYIGELKDGVKHGKGRLYENGVLIYDGEFENDIKNGTGNLYKNGELIYSGELKNGIRSGFGTQVAIDFVYTGLWKNDAYNGIGLYLKSNKEGYVGNFTGGKPDGRVNLIQNGIVFAECIFKNDACVFMKRYSNDGKSLVYEGSVRDGVPNGMGREYNEFGEVVFEGLYKLGKPYKNAKIIIREIEPLPECEMLANTDYELYRYPNAINK
ncbi:MAG: hypothetical protein PUC88_07370 [Clostridia bacterium]|nr:hypothetical protein [Clostridia bacterium]